MCSFYKKKIGNTTYFHHRNFSSKFKKQEICIKFIYSGKMLQKRILVIWGQFLQFKKKSSQFLIVYLVN